MPTVTFLPSGQRLEVAEGTTLFDAAHRAALPVASSCGGEFVCGKCAMAVRAGGERLAPQTEEERQLLVREGKDPTLRISCVTRVLGDCSVTTSYW